MTFRPAHLRLLALLALALIAVAVVAIVSGTVTAESSDPSDPGATEQNEDPRYSKKLPLPDKHTKNDPIKTNGKIFDAWPKPDATLVFTGSQEGYMEPCGCAGLTNQLGGLKRRHTFLKGLGKQGWNPVALDAGGQIKRFGNQAQVKQTFTLDALTKLNYRGVAFGTADLRLDMLGSLINLDIEKNPMVSANVAFFAFDDQFSTRFKVIEAGGLKIGVTSVLTKKQTAKLGKVGNLVTVDPAEGLKAAVPKLKQAGCDQLVLLVHGSSDEAAALAKQFPMFNWVVAALGADVPMLKPKKIEGTSAHLVETGHKGQYAVAIGLYKTGQTPFLAQNVPLDHRFEDSPEMQAVLVNYQNQLRAMTLKDLGIKAINHPSGRKFAGSDACQDCHYDAWEVFEKTPHSHAMKTLEKLTPQRHFDPECLSCHVTGWEPQKYVPFNSGYVSLKATPNLIDNGCENCHGPAARHVAAENGDIDVTPQEISKLRAELHMELVENEGNKDGQEFAKGKVVQNCMQCHDLDNSPDFDFQRYWPWVEHHGKE